MNDTGIILQKSRHIGQDSAFTRPTTVFINFQSTGVLAAKHQIDQMLRPLNL